ncbi:MAG: hypothetical protein JST92_07570, partial [Deltaproteobacteria bacterium]|nr:hypothetical protein [Deltaproteobacteria bacterium]
MRRIRPLFASLLASLCVLACSSTTADRTRTPLAPPAPAALPADVTSCNLLGDKQNGKECRLYDTQAKAFVDDTGYGAASTTEASVARRAFLYDRFLDLYAAPEHQVMVRNMNTAMAPSDPESRYADDQFMGFWDDRGDSAGFAELSLLEAAMRWKTTGTDADYQRLEDYVRGLYLQAEATGMPGYMARYHFAGVPPGTHILGKYSMHWRDPADTTQYSIPASQLAQFPGYYTAGLDVDGVHIATTGSWEGHNSIDSYAGLMNGYPLVHDLIKDPALKAGMVKHFTCFLKRLRIFKVTNLTKNPDLQAALRNYLQTGVLNFDADDPDLTKVDQLWGFYLPQYNVNSAATYPRECPSTGPAFDADPSETVDVTQPGYLNKLVPILLRLADTGDGKDAMDFEYFPGTRSGDAIMMRTYAVSAYHMTHDPIWLQWGSQVLDGQNNAREVEKTTGAFVLPKACRSYFRTYSLYGSLFLRMLIDTDPDERAHAVELFERKFNQKEMLGLGDSWFQIVRHAAQGTKDDELTHALSEILSFGGTKDLLDTPRRNYSVDLTVNTPPGLTTGPAPQSEIDVCTTPITVLGFTIPTPPPDPNDRFSNPAPLLMDRPPDNYIWEKDPFRARKLNGDSGQQQYPGPDPTHPYYTAPPSGHLPDH